MCVSQCSGSSCCGAWGLGLVGPAVAVPGLWAGSMVWPTGLAAPRRVGSSWTRDGTHGSCIGRQVLHHQGSPALVFCCFFFFPECSLQVPLRTQLLGSKEFKPHGETIWELRSELSQPEHRYMLVKKPPYCVRPHSFLSP